MSTKVIYSLDKDCTQPLYYLSREGLNSLNNNNDNLEEFDQPSVS